MTSPLSNSAWILFSFYVASLFSVASITTLLNRTWCYSMSISILRAGEESGRHTRLVGRGSSHTSSTSSSNTPLPRLRPMLQVHPQPPRTPPAPQLRPPPLHIATLSCPSPPWTCSASEPELAFALGAKQTLRKSAKHPALIKLILGNWGVHVHIVLC